jgi:DNA-binding CsgD family transcriptional regulator
MFKIKYFFLVLFFLSIYSCQKSKNEDFFLVDKLSYLEDFNQELNIETISNQPFIKLKDPKLGHKNGWYWFKIELKSSLKKDKLIFDLKGNTIDSYLLFNNQTQILSSENRLTLSSYSYKVAPSDSNTYYAKVHFKKHVFFPLNVYYLDDYYIKENTSFFIDGLFYGFVIIVFIVNLIFYFSLKDITFLTYAAFLALTNVGMTDYDGLMALYTTPEIRCFLSISLHFLVPLGTAVFTSTLLSHHKLVPKSVQIATVLLSIAIIFYIIFIVTKNFLFFAIGDLVGLCIFSYYMYLGICELKRQKFAKFSVLGYSLIWISGLLFVIPLNWGVSGFSLPLESVKIGSVFEMLVLTYAITYRVKLLQEENELFSSEIKKHIQHIFSLEEQLLENKNIRENKTSVEDKIENISSKHQLTTRESDILLQIVNGLNNPQIAEELFISVNTVKYHTKNIYEKLDVNKRTEITSKIFLEN